MKTTFLHQRGHERLLIFFNGWGMDNALFQHWRADACDVLCAWDYRELTPLPAVAGYRDIRLVAWSLGVWAAAVTPMPPLQHATAVNGTLQPIDQHSGIRADVFQGTIDNWLDDQARERFRQRVAGTAAASATPPATVAATAASPFPPGRLPLDQRDELLALQQNITSLPVPATIYDCALIGGRDRIFPPSAQRRFWLTTAVRILEWPDAPHYPFAAIQSWEELWHLE